MQELWEQLSKELSEKVTAQILVGVRREMTATNKSNFELCFTEKEAAEKLKISEVTLRRKRKVGEIDFSRVGGRVVYMTHHLLDYLMRNEVKNGKQTVGLDDILQLSAHKKAA